MQPDPNAARSMLEDLIAWVPALADSRDARVFGLPSAGAGGGRPGTSDPVPASVEALDEYREHLAPLVDLAFEWAGQTKVKIDADHALVFLHARVGWAARRTAFDEACALIARAHAWAAAVTGNGPERTDFSCPACFMRGHDVTLVRYPSERGYSDLAVCSECGSMHDEQTLQVAWRSALADADARMPRAWICRQFSISQQRFANWVRRGRIRPDEDGTYSLLEVHSLLKKPSSRRVS